VHDTAYLRQVSVLTSTPPAETLLFGQEGCLVSAASFSGTLHGCYNQIKVKYGCSIQLIQLTLQCKYKLSKTFDKFYASKRLCARTFSNDCIAINNNLNYIRVRLSILLVTTPFHKQASSKKKNYQTNLISAIDTG